MLSEDKGLFVAELQLKPWSNVLHLTKQNNATHHSIVAVACTWVINTHIDKKLCPACSVELIQGLTSIIWCLIGQGWSFQPENSWILVFSHVFIKICFWKHIWWHKRKNCPSLWLQVCCQLELCQPAESIFTRCLIPATCWDYDTGLPVLLLLWHHLQWPFSSADSSCVVWWCVCVFFFSTLNGSGAKVRLWRRHCRVGMNFRTLSTVHGSKETTMPRVATFNEWILLSYCQAADQDAVDRSSPYHVCCAR